MVAENKRTVAQHLSTEATEMIIMTFVESVMMSHDNF